MDNSTNQFYGKIEIQKDLYKSKAIAKLDYYEKGKLFYLIDTSFGKFQFPIDIIDKFKLVELVRSEPFQTYTLSEDLGETRFNAEIKGALLIRYINKAIDTGKFICLTEIDESIGGAPEWSQEKIDHIKDVMKAHREGRTETVEDENGIQSIRVVSINEKGRTEIKDEDGNLTGSQG